MSIKYIISLEVDYAFTIFVFKKIFIAMSFHEQILRYYLRYYFEIYIISFLKIYLLKSTLLIAFEKPFKSHTFKNFLSYTFTDFN